MGALCMWFFVGLTLGLSTELTLTYTYTDEYLKQWMECGEAFGIVEQSNDMLLYKGEMFEFCMDIINEPKTVECIGCIRL